MTGENHNDENPNIASDREHKNRLLPPPTANAAAIRRAPRDGDPPIELLQPTYPEGILPFNVAKAVGDAHAPVDDPSRYPPPPPPPTDTASGDDPISPPSLEMPPGNTTPPVVTQSADTLACTTGAWIGEPSIYSYRWQIDGADVGADTETHTVVAGDVGKTAACFVTATSDLGSTESPSSNEVTIADIVADDEHV